MRVFGVLRRASCALKRNKNTTYLRDIGYRDRGLTQNKNEQREVETDKEREVYKKRNGKLYMFVM